MKRFLKVFNQKFKSLGYFINKNFMKLWTTTENLLKSVYEHLSKTKNTSHKLIFTLSLKFPFTVTGLIRHHYHPLVHRFSLRFNNDLVQMSYQPNESFHHLVFALLHSDFILRKNVRIQFHDLINVLSSILLHHCRISLCLKKCQVDNIR